MLRAAIADANSSSKRFGAAFDGEQTPGGVVTQFNHPIIRIVSPF